jgi:hypothetical protein
VLFYSWHVFYEHVPPFACLQIAECIEALLPFIQERLLNELSLVLAGCPFVEPSSVLTAPASVPGSSAVSARTLTQQALYVPNAVAVAAVVAAVAVVEMVLVACVHRSSDCPCDAGNH